MVLVVGQVAALLAHKFLVHHAIGHIVLQMVRAYLWLRPCAFHIGNMLLLFLV